MKAKIISVLAILLLAGLSIVCSQTTMEEYNYLSEGYKMQIEKGLDMKKGYIIKEYDTWGMDYGTFERQVIFKGLFREGKDKPCAILMILRRTNSDYEEFICIPHYDSTDEMWDMAYRDFKTATDQWPQSARGYAWGMVHFISYLNQ